MEQPVAEADLGFGKRYRVRKSAEFRRISSRGRRYRTDSLTIVYQPARRDSRLGLTVSKKVGGAVVRNHLKRRVREFFRHHRSELVRAWHLVVIASPRAAGLSSAALADELRPVWTYLNRRGDEPRRSPRRRGGRRRKS